LPRIARIGDHQLGRGAVEAADRRSEAAHVHVHVVVIERAVEHRRVGVDDGVGARQREPEHVRHRLSPIAVAIAVPILRMYSLAKPSSLSHEPLAATMPEVLRLNCPGGSSKMRTPAILSASSAATPLEISACLICR